MHDLYLIDGYNLLNHLPDLASLANRDLEAAREALAARISQWCDTTNLRAYLIFDGRGRRSEERAIPGLSNRLRVIFTSHEKTADAIIERAVYESPRKESVIVVTADRGITSLCLGMGAITMRPEYFVSSLNEASAQVRERVEARKKDTEGFGRVEEQIGGAALDALQRLREKLGGERDRSDR